MRSLVLGTAGHIDHGKTELVRALTGVDTDRLREEKERGITIELGFAALPGTDVRLGVVDVPGHEGFVRTMLAGATGMDVVVLVVAADEGVMPQTREHLAIVGLLAVQRLVVALTKVDLVEPEWLELVRDEVKETLAATRYAGAPLVATSARTGQGIEELRRVLLDTAAHADPGDPDDLVVLPVDRAFTVRGTGTVVTGTLWSGRLAVGDRVRLLPGGHEGRVRGLQVHGAPVERAEAGERTAVALGGDVMDLDHVARGQALVTDPDWPPSAMLTVRLSLLADSRWEIEHNQRVRVHLGTTEVMARVVLFRNGPVRAGESAWGQLRLESPAAARTGQRLVLRSYSPMATIGGAEVAECHPPKRRRIDPALENDLRRTLDGSPGEVVGAVVARSGLAGTSRRMLPVTAGLSPRVAADRVEALLADGAVATPEGRVLDPAHAAEARGLLLERVDAVHRAQPYRPGVAVETLRDALPAHAAPGLADVLLGTLVGEGVLVLERGVAARTEFRATLTPGQEALEARLARIYEGAGLQPPTLGELPGELTRDETFWVLMRRLEDAGRLTPLDDGLFIWTAALDAAEAEVRRRLAGRTGLGPADFKEAVPVSRRHLLPILAWLDRTGVTRRDPGGRTVTVG
jgi:selenocysteine-specific elongation factor